MNYKKAYLYMFNALTSLIAVLMAIQRQAEELVIDEQE